jgi:hypothetical protein
LKNPFNGKRKTMHFIQSLLRERTYLLTFLIAITFIVASAIFPDQFPTFQNLQQILLNSAVETIVAVGMMVLLISGAFDLSVGSVAAMAGALTAWMMMIGETHFLIAIAVGLSSALLVGMFNGYFISYIGINPLIQTLATLGMVRGMALMIAGAGIQNLPYEFIYINSYPDLAAVCGFTSDTGPGIGPGLKEMDVVGKVYGTNVDASDVLLNLLKEGVLQYLVDQKRETFIWYGAEFVFNMAHNINAFPPEYLSTGVHGLPHSVNTGLIEITPETVNALLQ